jgi:glycosyltransferase involved in cell wall biosynthesis
MPKVLRIINRFNLGGPTYNATFLTKFISSDFETLLIGGLPEQGESDSFHIPEEYGINPVIIPELKRKPSIKSDKEAYQKIKKIILEFKPDIVHTHASKAGALGRRAAYACKVPVIVHTFHGHVFHSYFNLIKTNFFKLIERRLAKKTTAIIAISETQKKELSTIHKICPKEKIKIIPLGFDLLKFQIKIKENRIITRTKFNIQEDEVAIAIIGRLTKIKNHAFFLQVCEKTLSAGEKKIKIFIVGDGELKMQICKDVDRLNKLFNNELIFTSWIKDIAEFNAGMDIICLTSDNEGTPVSLIEAQASNVAVISSDVGGVKDIVNEGETGFIVPKGNLEEYVQKLGLLIKNKELRTRFSENGWGFVKERFHYTRLTSDMEALYYELITKSNEKKLR